MSRGDPKGGRPPLDPRVRAAVFGLAVEHPDWGSRRIARETAASRRSVQRWLAAEGLRGGAEHGDVVAYTASRGPASAPVFVDGQPQYWLTPGAAARAMDEADHLAFNAYRGAVYETPSVWWTGR